MIDIVILKRSKFILYLKLIIFSIKNDSFFPAKIIYLIIQNLFNHYKVDIKIYTIIYFIIFLTFIY
jgi:hypothetical protein